MSDIQKLEYLVAVVKHVLGTAYWLRYDRTEDAIEHPGRLLLTQAIAIVTKRDDSGVTP